MKRLLILLVGILVASCNSNTLFSKTDKDFADNRWQKSDIKTYEFEITQPATPYEIQVFFSHVYGYQFPSVPLIVEMTFPNGEIKSVPFTLEIKDESGEDLGDCAGDYCDLTQTIATTRPTELSPGKYKIRLMHNFEGEFLPNVLGVGIRVEQLAD